MAGRRAFGAIRRLPSGRFQASYVDPAGRRRLARSTFERRVDAAEWLAVQQAAIVRGEWRDPDRGRVPFGAYADRWIEERPNLRPRTVALYVWLLKKYLRPAFGDWFLGDISTAAIRRWRGELLAEGVSVSMASKAYRLMRAVLNTAVEQDELLSRNPCRVRGAGQETPAERPVLSILEVLLLADVMPARFRCLVLVTTFASLRFGEVSALQRRDVDLVRGTVTVRRAFTEVKGEGLVVGAPKSRAGRRTVVLPRSVVRELAAHMDRYVGVADDALVFTGYKGAALRRSNLNKLIRWSEAVVGVGRPGLHFHDLRHTGNTLAAGAGVSTRDLMARMGHDSMQAALIYQHATHEASAAIARVMDERLRDARRMDAESEREAGSDDAS
jgi:integrase